MVGDKIISFSQYSEQLAELRTIHYPRAGKNMVYPALKLAGEAGELADKIGKHWRNETSRMISLKPQLDSLDCEIIPELFAMSAASISFEQEAEIIKEMGDVLWYLNALCLELGTKLETVAEENIQKLLGRKERGTVLGQGDNR